MNNLIIFHLLLVFLTIVNCKKISTTKKSNLQKIKNKFWLNLIIGISILILLILSLILLYIFYIRKRINHKNEKVKRQMKDFDMSIIDYDINELDTIQTVGTPNEFIDHYSETEINTII